MKPSIVIGDVHGCAEELHQLLEELSLTPDCAVYMLGDLINRGPDPHGVFEILRGLKCPVRCLWGNHELRLLHYHQTSDASILKSADWDTLPKLTPADWLFMKERMEGPIFLEEQKTILVHGGFLPNMPWQDQSLDITTRIQVVGEDGKPYKRKHCPEGTPWESFWEGPPYVVYGHTPRPNIQRRQWTLGIDTGCVQGGHLSACILPTREIVQVPAQRVYHPSKKATCV